MPGILQMLLARGSSGGTSYTLQQAGSGTTAAVTLGQTSARKYDAGEIVAGASFTCTKIALSLGRIGTGTPVLTGYIWANNAGQPGTLLGTSTNTVNGTTLNSAAPTVAEFTFAGVALTNGTTYWFGVMADVIDAANYTQVYGGATSTANQYVSPDGTTWTANSTRRIHCSLYSSP